LNYTLQSLYPDVENGNQPTTNL